MDLPNPDTTTERLIIDTQYEINPQDEITAIQNGLKERDDLVRKITSPESSILLSPITEAIDQRYMEELTQIKDGKVTFEMYEPPIDSYPQVLGGYNLIQTEKLTQKWQSSLQYTKNIQDAAKTGATPIDDGTPETSLLALALDKGFMNPETEIRTDYWMKDSKDFLGLYATNLALFLRGNLKAFFVLDNTSTSVGIQKNDNKWEWVKREDLDASFSFGSRDYERIIFDTENWISQFGTTNEDRKSAIHYMQKERQDLEYSNARLKTLLSNPKAFADTILSSDKAPKRLMTYEEYEQLSKAIEKLASFPKPVAYDTGQGIKEFSHIYDASMNPVEINIYSLRNTATGLNRYLSSTDFPIQIMSAQNKPIGITTASYYYYDNSISIQESSGQNFLRDLNRLFNGRMQTWDKD